MQKILEETQLPADGLSILLDQDQDIIAYSDHAMVLKPIHSLIPNLTTPRITEALNTQQPVEISWDDADKLVWANRVSGSNWVLISVVDKQTLLAPQGKIMNVL